MTEQEQQLLLEIADDELILGWRDSEWTGIAPLLEEDVAFSSIAQNEIGHARALYELVARERGTTADELAFDRSPDEYRCAQIVELRLLDWAQTIARHYLYEEADAIRLERLKQSDDAEIAGLAAKIDREEAYHRMHAQMWHERLQDEPRYLSALGGASAPARATRRAHVRAARAVGRDDDGAALATGGHEVVTEAQVWDALAEIPDPEIPVISLVDLGVVREHRRRRTAASASTSRRRSSAALRSRSCATRWPTQIRALGAEPEINVCLDDSWSTDRITPAGPREAARVRLRAPGTARSNRADARAAAEQRSPLPVLRLDRDAAREHLRPDALQVAALLRELQAAVRAVQDDLALGRQIVLLRGINLGPRNRIAMSDLRRLLAGEGFEDVRTYFQSGNVVLSSSAKPGEVAGNANS